MAEFLGDLAFMFEVFVLGVGLWFVFLGRKEKSKLVSRAGWFMSVTSALGLICTTAFYLKYWNAGEFDHAYPHHTGMHQQMMMGGRGDGSSRHMMMNPKMMNNMHDSMMQCMNNIQGKTMGPDMMEKMKSCVMGAMPMGHHEK